MNTLVFFSCIFLLFSTTITVSAFDEIATVPDKTYIVNGHVYQNQSVLLKCSQADLDETFTLNVATPDGNVSVVSITCNAPQVTFDVTLKGWIPKNGLLIDRSVCRLSTNTIYTPGYSVEYGGRTQFITNASFFSQDYPLTRFSMMDQDDDILAHMSHSELYRKSSEYRQMWSALETNMANVYVGRKLLAPAQTEAALAGGTVELASGGKSFMQGGDYLNLVVGLIGVAGAAGDAIAIAQLFTKISALGDRVGDLQTSALNTSRYLNLFINQLNAYQLNQTSINLQTATSLNQIQNFLNISFYGQSVLQQMLTTQQNFTTTALAQVVSQVNSNMGNITQLASTTQSLTSQLQNLNAATNQSIYQLTLQLLNVSTVVNTFMANTVSTMNTMFSQTADKIIGLQQNDEQMAQIITLVYLDTEMRRAMTHLILNAIVNLTQGTTYTPFLSSYGIFPVVNVDNYVEIEIDNYRVNYMASNGLLYQVDITVYCSYNYMQTIGTPWHNWQDFLGAMGSPSSATPCTSTNTTNCFCFSQFSFSRCQPLSNITTAFFLNYSGIISSTMCQTGSPITQVDPLNGFSTVSTRIFVPDSVTFLNYLAAICNMGTFNSSQYRTTALGLGSTVLSQYDSSVCTASLTAIMSGPTSGSSYFNFMYAIFNDIDQSFRSAYGSMEIFNQGLDGVIAPDISFKPSPYTLLNNQSATCTEAAFVAYATPTHNPMIDMVPVYLLSNPRTVTPVTVSVNGSSYTQYDVTIQQQVGYSLASEYVVVGTFASGGMTYVYDSTESDVSLSNAPEARCGHYTYPLIDDVNNFTMARWQHLYAQTFDHYCATNFINQARTPVITGADGTLVCNVSIGTQLGNACLLLEELSIVSADYIYTNTTVWELKNAMYYVSVPIPIGSIEIVQNTGCPTVSIQATNTQGVYAMLTNSFASALDVILAVTGACNYQVPGVIRIPAMTTKPVSIGACGSGNGHITLTVYQTNGFAPTVPCSNAQGLDVTTNRTAVLFQTGIADQLYVNQSTTVINSQTMLQLQSIITSSFSAISQMNTLMALQAVSLYTTVTPPNIQSYQNISNTLTIIYSNITTQLNTLVNSTGLNLTSITAPFLQRMADLNAQFNATQAAELASLTALGADLNVLNNSIYQQIQTQILEIQYARNFSDSLAQFMFLQVAFDQAVADLSGGNIFGFFSAAIRGVEGIPADLINAANDLKNLLIDEIKNALNLPSFFGDIGKWAGYFIFGIMVVIAAYFIWKWYSGRQGSGGSSGGGGTTTVRFDPSVKRDLEQLSKKHDKLQKDFNNLLERVKALENSRSSTVVIESGESASSSAADDVTVTESERSPDNRFLYFTPGRSIPFTRLNRTRNHDDDDD